MTMLFEKKIYLNVSITPSLTLQKSLLFFHLLKKFT